MTYDQKMVVRRYIEEVVNTGNLERVADFVVAADVENAKAHILGVRTTYPDLHVTVVSQIAEAAMSLRGSLQGARTSVHIAG